jgi:hypothetical protein
MAERFMHPECGPEPLPEDYLKPNGKTRWTSYNKAKRKFTACAQTAIRKSEANVAARAASATAIAGSAAELGGDIAAAFAPPPVAAPASNLTKFAPFVAVAALAWFVLGDK